MMAATGLNRTKAMIQALIFLYHCIPCSEVVIDAANGHTATSTSSRALRRIMKSTSAIDPKMAKIETMIVRNGVIANKLSCPSNEGADLSNG